MNDARTDAVWAEARTSDLSASARVVTDLHARRGKTLWGFARRCGLSEEEAADVVQDAMLRLFAELERGARVADPDAWSFRVVYRLAMDRHRRARVIARIRERLHNEQSRSDADATERLAVWAEVNLLPERQRAVLYLRYRADLSFEEIAAAMGITAGAARSQATTAVARLRERMAGEER